MLARSRERRCSRAAEESSAEGAERACQPSSSLGSTSASHRCTTSLAPAWAWPQRAAVRRTSASEWALLADWCSLRARRSATRWNGMEDGATDDGEDEEEDEEEEDGEEEEEDRLSIAV